ncbi:MAG TPA: alanine racemase [Candidatus Paceibacterota bacterium]|nr:alanine racemase [Candidatus Paceibacterota bacterium]
MSAKKSSVRHNRSNKNIKNSGVRTWIELDQEAIKHNVKIFRKLIGPKTKLWSVVKSNAYGHGLSVFAKLADKAGVDPTHKKIMCGVDGFCVDSLIEGLRLRKEGIKKPILVLGYTLPHRFGEAAAKKITITISNRESLDALCRAKKKPFYHLKVDSGMHRQGFYPEEIPGIIKYLDKNLSGVYSHFASAKDTENSEQSAYTEKQFANFKKAFDFLERAGFKGLTRHISATAGAIVSPEYHLDAVRIGIGLYGLWPSKELEKKFSRPRQTSLGLAHGINLHPVLSWRAIISEIKTAKPGGYIGYDMTEKVTKPITYALLPLGYWHGISRSLSGKGEVLINGKRARILGRVSMDMVVVDVSGISCKTGDIAIIIGKSGKDEIPARDIAELSGTSHYEFLTRLNPLMEKRIL